MVPTPWSKSGRSLWTPLCFFTFTSCGNRDYTTGARSLPTDNTGWDIEGLLRISHSDESQDIEASIWGQNSHWAYGEITYFSVTLLVIKAIIIFNILLKWNVVLDTSLPHPRPMTNFCVFVYPESKILQESQYCVCFSLLTIQKPDNNYLGREVNFLLHLGQCYCSLDPGEGRCKIKW